jgi:hypothetical protein
MEEPLDNLNRWADLSGYAPKLPIEKLKVGSIHVSTEQESSARADYQTDDLDVWVPFAWNTHLRHYYGTGPAWVSINATQSSSDGPWQ